MFMALFNLQQFFASNWFFLGGVVQTFFWIFGLPKRKRQRISFLIQQPQEKSRKEGGRVTTLGAGFIFFVHREPWGDDPI